jgi:hypothetical protein
VHLAADRLARALNPAANSFDIVDRAHQEDLEVG